jgi:hypothetical protein
LTYYKLKPLSLCAEFSLIRQQALELFKQFPAKKKRVLLILLSTVTFWKEKQHRESLTRMQMLRTPITFSDDLEFQLWTKKV